MAQTEPGVADTKRLFGEYADRGEYHKELSADWSYYPIYRRKIELLARLFDRIPKTATILDAGCGEGVMVDELRRRGYTAVGVDRDYASADVIRGDILSLPFENGHFDVVMFLDVIEHLPFEQQPRALRELRRVLKPGGMLILTIPNLAHLYSRMRFLLSGKLKRTASIEKHPGDRPIAEFLELIRREHLRIEKRHGIFPTLPFLYRYMSRRPRQTLWLHALLNRVAYPNFSFLNLIVCRVDP